MRDPSNPTQWFWSGGGQLNQNKTFWLPGEPNNFYKNEDGGACFGDLGWYDAPNTFLYSVLCYKVHVVTEKKTWYEALEHCRKNHRDLASVASETELMLIQRELRKSWVTIDDYENVWIGMTFLADKWMWVDGQPLEYEAWGPAGKPGCPEIKNCGALQSDNMTSFWIGLTRSPTNNNEWMWSGGGKLQDSQAFWFIGEPNNNGGTEDSVVSMGDSGWLDISHFVTLPFFCYKVHVVKEMKTYEEALEYCRKNHRDLASVASETELMLMRTELRKWLITEHVWIGIRFLGDEWMWVDGQPLEYEVWGGWEKPGCPEKNAAQLCRWWEKTLRSMG
ncbi:hypothetical protein WMY93_022353 [Mugilogobius chulae]|uniref:C-type lectin domain-containing protein n=1 Tax=Mugilogobius chulae TaxID=88201 RepID=A0AAW0NJ50_9GOBI